MATMNVVPRKKVFLSYSRSELYFSEAVVDALSNDFDVWFDIQRLLPGLDWVAEIGRGLTNCDVLVLIASQSALHSPNVADEWETALKRGVPIYLLAYENLDFTPYIVPDTTRLLALDKLKEVAAGVIDCRRDFDANISRLIVALHTRLDTVLDAGLPLPTPDPNDRIGTPKTFTLSVRKRPFLDFNIPTKVPQPVAAVAFALLYNLAMIIFFSIARLSLWWQTSVVGLLLVGLLANQAIEFVSRRFRYNQIRWTLALSAIFITYLMWHWLPLALVEFFVCTRALILMSRERALLRWAPRGQGPSNLRTHIRRRDRAQELSTPVNRRYVIHANPADRRVIPAIRSAMNRAGFTEGWNVENQSTDIHLCVVTNASRPEDFASVAHTSDALVWIVASHLADTTPYQVYMNRQWVDYRTRNRAVLRRLAQALRPDAPVTAQRQFAINVTPQDFRLYIMPPRIAWLNLILFAIGSFFAVLIGYYFFQVSLPSGPGFLPKIVAIYALILAYVGILFVLLLRYSNGLVGRTLNVNGGVLWLVLFLLMLHGFLVAFNNFRITDFIWIPPVMVIAYALLRSWLPDTAPRTRIRQWFRFQMHRAMWRRNAFTYAAVFLVFYGFVGNVPYTGIVSPVQDQIKTASQIPVDHLMIQVPTYWLQEAISDDLALHRFGQKTMDMTPFSEIQDLNNDTPYADESSFAREIRRDQNPTDATRQGLASVTWVALHYDHSAVDFTIMVSVWRVSAGHTPSELLKIRQANPLTNNQYGTSDSPSVQTKGTAQCLVIPRFFYGPDWVSKEYYCAVDGANVMVDLMAGYLVEQTTIDSVSESITVN